MKLRNILVCLVLLVCLTACAPDSADAGATPSPTVSPTPTVTVMPDGTPEIGDREEPTELVYYLEGMEERIYAVRHYSDLGYSMVYDPDTMVFGREDGVDRYIAKTESELAVIQITIAQETRSVDEIAAELIGKGAEDIGYAYLDGCTVRRLYRTEGELPSYDDTVLAYSLVQAGGRVYTIENRYYADMAEGFGSRMMQMIGTVQFEDVPAATGLLMMFRDREIEDFTSAVGEVTQLRLGTDNGGRIGEVQWTSSDENVCSLIYDGGSCFVTIEGVGVAKVTVTCGDLSASTVVRGIKNW